MTIYIMTQLALLSRLKALNSSTLKYPLLFCLDNIRDNLPDWQIFCHNSFDIYVSGMIWRL